MQLSYASRLKHTAHLISLTSDAVSTHALCSTIFFFNLAHTSLSLSLSLSQVKFKNAHKAPPIYIMSLLVQSYCLILYLSLNPHLSTFCKLKKVLFAFTFKFYIYIVHIIFLIYIYTYKVILFWIFRPLPPSNS